MNETWFLIVILQVLLVPVLIIGGIIFFVRYRRKSSQSATHAWYAQAVLSSEDGISQTLITLGLAFLGITLFAINRDFNDIVSWQTVLLITSLIGILKGYYAKLLYPVALSLVGLVVWWGAQAGEWIEISGVRGSAVIGGLLCIVLLMYLAGRLHEQKMEFKRLTFVYYLISLVPLTIGLIIFSSQEGLQSLQRMLQGSSIVENIPIAVSLFIFGAAIVAGALYGFNRALITKTEIAFVAIFAALAVAIVFAKSIFLFDQNLDFDSLQAGRTYLSMYGNVWAILLNLASFAEMVFLIFIGYVRREEWMINLGGISLFFFIIIKYFDWFFTFLSKSAFFMSAGILLLAIGWLMERGRRYMIEQVKNVS